MKYHEKEESYNDYEKSMEAQGYKFFNIINNIAVLCECRRLYKDRRDEKGKKMCSVCYTGLDLESLKRLWNVDS